MGRVPSSRRLTRRPSDGAIAAVRARGAIDVNKDRGIRDPAARTSAVVAHEGVSLMPRSVRIGFIGCGSVMQDGYLPIARDLHAHGLVELRVACDTDPTRALLV